MAQHRVDKWLNHGIKNHQVNQLETLELLDTYYVQYGSHNTIWIRTHLCIYVLDIKREDLYSVTLLNFMIV